MRYRGFSQFLNHHELQLNNMSSYHTHSNQTTYILNGLESYFS